MDPRFGAFNVTTGLLAALTISVLIARVRGVVQSNWPLLYYVGVIFYTTLYEGYIDPAWVYAGVVSSLLLRFEFMGGIFLTIIRLIDIVVLCYLAYVSVVNLLVW